MTKAYIVASINVTDPDGFEEYKNAAVKVRKEFGGTLLVNGGRTEAIEGAFHNRIVVIEFESIEAARGGGLLILAAYARHFGPGLRFSYRRRRVAARQSRAFQTDLLPKLLRALIF